MIVHVVAFGVAQGGFELEKNETIQSKIFPRLEEMDRENMTSLKAKKITDRDGNKIAPTATSKQLQDGQVIFLDHGK